MGAAATEEMIDRLLRDCEPERHDLIPILQRFQHDFDYLSRESVAAIARHLRVSENEVFGVATFFTQFRFRPPGRHRIKVCQGTACHVRGSSLIMEELCGRLGIQPGEATADGEFEVERVACFGSCALAPVVVIDERVHGLLTPKKANVAVDAVRSKHGEKTA